METNWEKVQYVFLSFITSTFSVLALRVCREGIPFLRSTGVPSCLEKLNSFYSYGRQVTH